ncbi:hypothetical protein J6590_047122 [Homalodisca vitripennis]|nr:hypothetical protein J6590_047122 [Homalodisca vitripennis]
MCRCNRIINAVTAVAGHFMSLSWQVYHYTDNSQACQPVQKPPFQLRTVTKNHGRKCRLEMKKDENYALSVHNHWFKSEV